MTDLSGALNLAPSTVSQHLQELENKGAIEKVDNPHIKKWKHYRLKTAKPQPQTYNKFVYFGAASSLVLLGSIAIILFMTGSLFTWMNTVAISLTDPPIVPAGTQALYIHYTSLQVHVINQSGSPIWISSNSNGTINLTKLVNVSQVIADVQIPQNSTIDDVRFNISPSQIVINGVEYNVVLEQNVLDTKVALFPGANSSMGMLLDLTPIVSYTNNGYVMLPSLRAFTAGKSEIGAHVGQRTRLTSKLFDKLQLNTSIDINKASLASNPSTNITKFSVTVQNDENNSILIDHIVIYSNHTNCSVGHGLTKRSPGIFEPGFLMPHNVTHDVSSQAFCQRVIGFTTEQNGTLTNSYGPKGGYTMTPQSTATFAYSGVLSIGKGDSQVWISLKPRYTYTILAILDNGEYTKANVTVS